MAAAAADCCFFFFGHTPLARLFVVAMRDGGSWTMKGEREGGDCDDDDGRPQASDEPAVDSRSQSARVEVRTASANGGDAAECSLKRKRAPRALDFSDVTDARYRRHARKRTRACWSSKQRTLAYGDRVNNRQAARCARLRTISRRRVTFAFASCASTVR